MDVLGGPTALAVIDERGLVAAWNPQAAELLGFAATEVVERPALRLLARPADAIAARDVAHGVGEWTGDVPLVHRDGHHLDVHVRAQRLASGSGRFQWLVTFVASGIGRGPGDRAMLDWVRSRSPMAMTVYDTDLRCVWQNAAMSALSGASAGDLCGPCPQRVPRGPDMEEWERRMRRVLATGEPCLDFQIRGRTHADPDHEHLFSMSASLLQDRNGDAVGICTTAFDVTDRFRDRERLALLNEASVRIGTTLDVMQTAQELTDIVVPRLADFADVDLLDSLLRGEEPIPGPITGSMVLRRVAQQSMLPGAPEAVVALGDVDVYTEHSPPAVCLATGRSTLHRTMDEPIASWVAADPARGAKITKYGFHSWMIVPVRARGLTLGVVLFGRTTCEEPFEEADLALAEELVARAAVCLDNARRFARERAAALTLQRSLLPQGLPEQAAAEAAYRYLPADVELGVGGDWFDVIPLSGARVALVVGDVVGHGIHAAAAMGRLRTAVRTLADVDLAPDELLTHLDDLVIRLSAEANLEEHGTGGDIGATCLYAVYDPASNRCSVARAGHPPPAVVRPDGTVELLDLPAGPPLGLGGMPFESTEVELAEGSVLALYTDGLIESRHRDVDRGIDELRRALADPAASLEAVCDNVIASLLPDGPKDDVVLLLARPRAFRNDQVASWDLPAEPEIVARARADAARQLTEWDLEDAIFTTELIVSELVTNAIRYGQAPIRLRLIRDRSLICEVSDGTNTVPHLRRARTFDEGGRGLLLVAQFAQRWGTRQSPTGKTIWCEQVLPDGHGAKEASQPPVRTRAWESWIDDECVATSR
ncbi:SpoIIE family protein phosphatase [Embleya sp. NPDC001921]